MRVLRTLFLIFVLPVIALLAAGSTAAPLQSRTLRGTVVDPAGSALPGVAVELRIGAVVERRTVSDAAGGWRFENVGPEPRIVRFALSGFVTTELHVPPGESFPASVRVVMKVGAVSEQVEVVDARGADPAVGGIPGGTIGGVVGGISGAPPPPPPAAPVGGLRTLELLRAPVPRGETATYARVAENVFRRVADHPLSTFSIDVDTASYANVRRFLNQGRLPPADAVRIEELINYFRFDYPDPGRDAPLSVTTEVGAAPWNPGHKLVLVGLRSLPVRLERTPPRNLTFLLDVSGSMSPPNRLPLVKTAMQMLADTLRPDDKVAIVVYAGGTGVALPAPAGARREIIKRAIEELRPGGSTNGAAGIQLAYDIASENFVKGGINRVILATDGDFNVGITSRDDLTRLIEEKRATGIFLSVLGVGDDNLQDATMEMLADKGNGNYAYLDSVQEARRVLIAEAGATLVTVAKDVKLQIEFNPRFVGAYRLIGYENRVLQKEDFNNDRKDAGELGAGHTVTALYELVPPGEPVPGGDVDPLKYQLQPARASPMSSSAELMTVKVRYKAPDGEASRLLEFPVRVADGRASANLGFAAAVAEFGMLLRRSEFSGSASWTRAAARARQHRGPDEDGYRGELVRLIELAATLDTARMTRRE